MADPSHTTPLSIKGVLEDQEECVLLCPVAEVPETRLEDVVGSAGYQGPRLSLDDMEAGIAEGARL